MFNYHLAILKRPYLDAILAGTKTIESRLTKTRRVPFGQIKAGDIIYLKVSSGPVVATAKVTAVKQFENLKPKQVLALKLQYNDCIKGSDEYWQSKIDSRFGLLVWLTKIERIEPVMITKKDWRAWVILTKDEDFGLLGR